MPGAAESWWALLTENRGPLCGIQSHGRASSSVFGSEKRLWSRVSLLGLQRCPGAPGLGFFAPPSREGQIQSSNYPPEAGSCILSISR